jgi:SAM-dependent methyltransferase
MHYTSVPEPGTKAPCTVCHARQLVFLVQAGGVDYWRCQRCEATLMDAVSWPDRATEKAVYDLHDNNPDDPGYRRFLRKLLDPLQERLRTPASGLDFGCGPGPALAQMLTADGHRVALYDPVYYPDAEVLKNRYDFVTATEVLEHLHAPAATLKQLDCLLRPGGWLAVMTCFQTDDVLFPNWHYRRDPTHVVFYREATLAWIAQHFGWSLTVPVKDVALFQKPGATS